MKKRILTVSTGGTIACQETSDGMMPVLYPSEIIDYVPQVKELCDIESIQIMNMDSTNIGPQEWIKIAETVETEYENFDGFVVTHGTDTLAYTAAALSYLIQDSGKPIVLTGAQKPISGDITDAKMNLIDSVLYALNPNSHNVSIVFNGIAIAGTRGKKVRTKSYHAFTSINYPILAVIQDGKVFHYFDKSKGESITKFYHSMSNNVFLLKLIPGVGVELFDIIFAAYECIIVESYGVGGIPVYFMERFQILMKKYPDRIVIICTQVQNEGSNIGLYQVGRGIQQYSNVIEAYDMTIEAVVTKMMWILGKKKNSIANIKKLFYTKINNDIIKG